MTEEQWHLIEDHYKNGQLIKAKAVDENQEGLIVDIAGIKGVIPLAHIFGLQREDVALGTENQNTKAKLQSMKGKELYLKIIALHQEDNRLVLSERLAVQERRQRRHEELLSELHPGDVRRGIVRIITKFGAFVDLGGADGLVQLSQISWHRINHPSEVLHIGQEVDVQVLGIDKVKKKIALSIKQAQRNL